MDGATEEKALTGFWFSLVEGYDDDGLCARDAFPLEGKLRREQEEVGGDADALDLLEQGIFCPVICVYPFSQSQVGTQVLLRTVACFESSSFQPLPSVHFSSEAVGRGLCICPSKFQHRLLERN